MQGTAFRTIHLATLP